MPFHYFFLNTLVLYFNLLHHPWTASICWDWISTWSLSSVWMSWVGLSPSSSTALTPFVLTNNGISFFPSSGTKRPLIRAEQPTNMTPLVSPRLSEWRKNLEQYLLTSPPAAGCLPEISPTCAVWIRRCYLYCLGPFMPNWFGSINADLSLCLSWVDSKVS